MPLTIGSEFQQLARSMAPAFKTMLQTWVAVRHGISWEVRYCRTIFGTFVPTQLIPDIQIRTSSLRASRKVTLLGNPVEEVDALLAEPHRPVISEIEQTFSWESGSDSQFHRFYPPEYPGVQRWPTLRITAPAISGQGTTEATKLQLELLAYERPYEDMADLYEDLGLPRHFSEENSPSVTELILSPVCEILSDSVINEEGICVRVRASPAIVPEALLLGIKAYGRNQLERFSVKGDRFEWSDEGGERFGKIVIPSQDVPMAQTALSYQGEHLQKWVIRDESNSFNQLLDIHRAIDPADTLTSDDFFSQKTDFEERVGLLLSLLGLRLLKYGQIPKLTDAPDILALSEQNHLYVVECTTGDVNAKGKVQKLADRTKQIEERLKGSVANPLKVVGVMITSLPRHQTAAHWSQLSNLEIALVCREELESLISQVPAPPIAERLYQIFLETIPKRDEKT